LSSAQFNATQPLLSFTTTCNEITNRGYRYDAAGNLTSDSCASRSVSSANRKPLRPRLAANSLIPISIPLRSRRQKSLANLAEYYPLLLHNHSMGTHPELDRSGTPWRLRVPTPVLRKEIAPNRVFAAQRTPQYAGSDRENGVAAGTWPLQSIDSRDFQPPPRINSPTVKLWSL
jgi:hypothetical protein